MAAKNIADIHIYYLGSHRETHNAKDGIVSFKIVFLQHSRDGVLHRLIGLCHDPYSLASEGDFQPETQSFVQWLASLS